MHGMRMGCVAAIVALAMGGVGGSELQAQTQQQASQEVRATQLEARASTLMNDVANAEEAAGLFRQAAEIRGSSPASVDNLVIAGQLAFHAGHGRQAVQDLVKAGETALELGDAVTAANAFMNAAWVENERGNGVHAKKLMDRVQVMATSPYVAQADREKISRLLSARG